MIKQKKLWDNILTVIMALLCLLWIYPEEMKSKEENRNKE